jgi:hypothetical protein
LTGPDEHLIDGELLSGLVFYDDVLSSVVIHDSPEIVLVRPIEMDPELYALTLIERVTSLWHLELHLYWFGLKTCVILCRPIDHAMVGLAFSHEHIGNVLLLKNQEDQARKESCKESCGKKGHELAAICPGIEDGQDAEYPT